MIPFPLDADLRTHFDSRSLEIWKVSPSFVRSSVVIPSRRLTILAEFIILVWLAFMACSV